MKKNKSLWTYVKFLVNLFESLQRYLLIIVLLSIAFGMLLEVSLRLANYPLFALEDMIVYILGWLYFFGTAVNTKRDSHIRADILGNVMEEYPRHRELIRCISNLVGAFLMILLCNESWQYLMWSVSLGEESISLGITTKYAILSMPIGFGLSSLYFIINAVSHLNHFLNWGKSDNIKK